MSEAKFTKGEWDICDGDSHSKEIVISTEDREDSLTVPICEMDIRFSGRIGEEQVANACLIAAAPEMYELLASLRGDYGMSSAVGKEIDTLLAKARGE